MYGSAASNVHEISFFNLKNADSCTFCTPHFFYINSNKPTAGRTKAIHRRLELSFNLYLLLLLWVKTELPKTAYI